MQFTADKEIPFSPIRLHILLESEDDVNDLRHLIHVVRCNDTTNNRSKDIAHKLLRSLNTQHQQP